jgi:formylglycine-generating enzyme required for sulfatase activity
VKRFAWVDGAPPPGREEHPVVLVTWADAKRYCEWRGRAVGSTRRLPTAAEYEKASRGTDGSSYPWGNLWDATKLNSAVGGPSDTVPVGGYPPSAGFAILDLAGNVFQWTASKWDADEMTVKGSAWDDFGGVGRGASGHGRPTGARHVIVGFRCASDPEAT